MGLIKEFKEFAMRGNVVDMAVGIVIGAAFTKIVSSLVNDIILPPIGAILGGADFTNLYINLSGGDYPSLAAAQAAGAATINFGSFLNSVLDFGIVAVAIFVVIKGMNIARRRLDAEITTPKDGAADGDAPANKPVPPEIALLTEIRDALKRDGGSPKA